MSNNTQAVNNTSKVQQGPVKTALKTSKESPVNFNALFADAMGQNNPKAQLSTFETQMREALGKQDERKAREPEANPMASEAAQSMVWAQRNWANQQNPERNPSQPDTAMSATAAESQSPRPQTEAKATDQASKPESNAQQNSSTSDAPAQPPAQAQATQQTPQPANATQPAQEALASSNTSPSVVHPAATAERGVQPDLPTTQNSAIANTDSAALKTQEANGQTATTQVQVTPEKGTAEAVNQGAARSEKPVDAVLTNAEISGPTRELQAQEKSNGINNPIAAQNVSVQLGQQRTAMVSNQTEQLEVQGLKAGDQKLTTANTGNPIAGLATTQGIGPKAAAQTLIKTPVNQPGFARELGQTVNWALGRGMSTVDIRVNPESFGPMNMRLVQKGQQVQLVIRTQDEASANLMSQAIAGLKETLAQSGLNLQQVQVQHAQAASSGAGNTNLQQSMQGSGNGQQSGSNSHTGQGPQGQRTSETLEDSIAATPTPRNTSKTGGIDLFA